MTAIKDPAKTLPPLENGDVMSSEEFWRRYKKRHDIKKAEHIKGVVYVPSLTYLPHHSEPHFIVIGWLAAYTLTRPGLRSSDNGTLVLPTGDTVEPDVAIFRESAAVTIPDKGPVEGTPELVVEISATTTSYDLHVKKDQYEASGVKEYIVWRTYDEEIDWFRLIEGKYQRIEPRNGRIESSVFPGLILDIDALLAEDYATVLARVAPTAPSQ